MNKKNIITAWFCLLASVTFVSAQERTAKLDSLFLSRYRENMFNGNVLVADRGKVIYRQAFGYANLEHKILNRVSTRSDLGSTSKLFTAVAILQLKEKGLIQLGDPVIRYLPDFPYPDIRIWHLLTHTSGLPDFEIFDAYYAKDPNGLFTNKDVIPAIRKYGKTLFKPGEKWSYSSPGMALLASIVEKVSGQTMERYLIKRIWSPAGMHHTYINSLSAPVTDTGRVENYATGEYFSDELFRADTMQRHKQFSQVSGALIGPGLVVSDTHDLLLFDQALYAGKLLAPATMDEAFTPIKLTGGDFARPQPWLGDTYFGLGWFILQGNSCGKMVLHTGKHAGIVTVFVRNLDKRQTLVLFDNTESFGLNNLSLNALNILNGKPLMPLRRSLAKLYSRELLQRGPDFSLSHFNLLKADTTNYYLNVQEMDYAGHQLIERGHPGQGLETLRLLTVIDSRNSFPYYSYGISLMQCGKPTEAAMSLKKALTVDPGNKQAAEALENILKASDKQKPLD